MKIFFYALMLTIDWSLLAWGAIFPRGILSSMSMVWQELSQDRQELGVFFTDNSHSEALFMFSKHIGTCDSNEVEAPFILKASSNLGIY